MDTGFDISIDISNKGAKAQDSLTLFFSKDGGSFQELSKYQLTNSHINAGEIKLPIDSSVINEEGNYTFKVQLFDNVNNELGDFSQISEQISLDFSAPAKPNLELVFDNDTNLVVGLHCVVFNGPIWTSFTWAWRLYEYRRICNRIVVELQWNFTVDWYSCGHDNRSNYGVPSSISMFSI